MEAFTLSAAERAKARRRKRVESFAPPPGPASAWSSSTAASAAAAANASSASPAAAAAADATAQSSASTMPMDNDDDFPYHLVAMTAAEKVKLKRRKAASAAATQLSSSTQPAKNGESAATPGTPAGEGGKKRPGSRSPKREQEEAATVERIRRILDNFGGGDDDDNGGISSGDDDDHESAVSSYDSSFGDPRKRDVSLDSIVGSSPVSVVHGARIDHGPAAAPHGIATNGAKRRKTARNKGGSKNKGKTGRGGGGGRKGKGRADAAPMMDMVSLLSNAPATMASTASTAATSPTAAPAAPIATAHAPTDAGAAKMQGASFLPAILELGPEEIISVEQQRRRRRQKHQGRRTHKSATNDGGSGGVGHITKDGSGAGCTIIVRTEAALQGGPSLGIDAISTLVEDRLRSSVPLLARTPAAAAAAVPDADAAGALDGASIGSAAVDKTPSAVSIKSKKRGRPPKSASTGKAAAKASRAAATAERAAEEEDEKLRRMCVTLLCGTDDHHSTVVDAVLKFNQLMTNLVRVGDDALKNAAKDTSNVAGTRRLAYAAVGTAARRDLEFWSSSSFSSSSSSTSALSASASASSSSESKPLPTPAPSGGPSAARPIENGASHTEGGGPMTAAEKVKLRRRRAAMAATVAACHARKCSGTMPGACAASTTAAATPSIHGDSGGGGSRGDDADSGRREDCGVHAPRTRQLALLRRMMSPLCCRVVVVVGGEHSYASTDPAAAGAGAGADDDEDEDANYSLLFGDDDDDEERGGGMPASTKDAVAPPSVVASGVGGGSTSIRSCVRLLDYSLLDVLLRIDALRPHASEGILRRLLHLERMIDGSLVDATDAGASSSSQASTSMTRAAAAEAATECRDLLLLAMGRSFLSSVMTTGSLLPPGFVRNLRYALASVPAEAEGGRKRRRLRDVIFENLPPGAASCVVHQCRDLEEEEQEQGQEDEDEEDELRLGRMDRAEVEAWLRYGGGGRSGCGDDGGGGGGRSRRGASPLHGPGSTVAGRVGDNIGGVEEFEARSCPRRTWRPERIAIRRERERLRGDFDRVCGARDDEDGGGGDEEVSSASGPAKASAMGAPRAGNAAIDDGGGADDGESKGGAGPVVRRRSSRQVQPKGRSTDGSLIVSGNEMPIDQFLERSRLMLKVNDTFPRTSVPGVSKPTLQQLNLSAESVAKLRDAFFDEDGSLRNDVRGDIDTSIKNDARYITFKNRRCKAERRDTRWQVPIRHHGIGHDIQSRKIVEDIFEKEKVLAPGCERVDDIGLLFGGTEDQSLHHDTARQVTSWLPQRPVTNQEAASAHAVPGWEIDRLEYNKAMASPYAPGSIIIGLHHTDKVFLGVQKDHVEKMSGGKTCKIIGGSDRIFRIIRENSFLVVIEIHHGAMFTGDFPHAGVRNFPRHSHGGSRYSHEEELMKQLNRKIAAILAETPSHERVLRTSRMIDMMCNFPELNKLCRLHCSTEMLKGHICVPPNTIGFTDCWPNPPDRRCYDGEEDTLSEEEACGTDKGNDCTTGSDKNDSLARREEIDDCTTSGLSDGCLGAGEKTYEKCSGLERNGPLLLSEVSAPDIGPGWIFRKFQRGGMVPDRKRRIDRYWYSPEGRRFRSMKEVDTYLSVAKVGTRN